MNIYKETKSRQQWIKKAKEKTEEAAQLRKQNKRLRESRDQWKEKYKQEKRDNQGSDLSSLKKKTLADIPIVV